MRKSACFPSMLLISVPLLELLLILLVPAFPKMISL